MSAVKGSDNVLAALHNLHVNFNQGSKSVADAMDVKTPLGLRFVISKKIYTEVDRTNISKVL